MTDNRFPVHHPAGIHRAGNARAPPRGPEESGCTNPQRSINRREKERTMKTTQRTGLYPTARLETGAAILAAVEIVDVNLVKPRVRAFMSAHRGYTEAQQAV